MSDHRRSHSAGSGCSSGGDAAAAAVSSCIAKVVVVVLLLLLLLPLLLLAWSCQGHHGHMELVGEMNTAIGGRVSRHSTADNDNYERLRSHNKG